MNQLGGLLLAGMVCVAPSALFGDEVSVVRSIQPDAKAGQSGAVLVRGVDLVQTGQILPNDHLNASVEAQARDVCTRLDQLLKLAGTSLKRSVKVHVYLADSAHADVVQRVIAEHVDAKTPPAVAYVTTSLPGSGALVVMDAIAAADGKGTAVEVHAEDIGTYAVLPAAARSRSYVSGQAEKAPTAAEGTKLTMGSLVRTLDFLELAKSDVVQVKAFVAPMSDAGSIEREIAAVFAPAPAPPVSLVEWESKDYPVEIELVAATTKPLGSARPSLEFLTPPGMTTPTVYCRVARVQHPTTIFVSGLYGSQADPNGEGELRELFDRTKSLAEEGGSDLTYLVKATYYVSDVGSNQQHNRLRPEYYDPKRPPAASKAQVKGVGRAGRTITWDMIAVPVERP